MDELTVAMTRWHHGGHHGVVFPGGAALLESSAKAATVESTWESLRSGRPLEECRDELLAGGESREPAGPGFALVVVDGEHARVVVRYPFVVRYVAAAGEGIVAADPTTPVKELQVGGLSSAVLCAEETAPTRSTLGRPALDAVVPADMIVVSCAGSALPSTSAESRPSTSAASPSLPSSSQPSPGGAEVPVVGRLVASTGVIVELTAPVVIGRAPSARRGEDGVVSQVLTLPYRHVSSDHLWISCDEQGAIAQDLRSTNGTYLRRSGGSLERLETPTRLDPGDVLDLGSDVQVVFEVAPRS